MVEVFLSDLLKGAYPMPTFTWSIDANNGAITAVLDKNGEVYSAELWY